MHRCGLLEHIHVRRNIPAVVKDPKKKWGTFIPFAQGTR